MDDNLFLIITNNPDSLIELNAELIGKGKLRRELFKWANNNEIKTTINHNTIIFERVHDNSLSRQ